MKKVDATVRRETRYIAIFTVLLSILLQAVFLIIRRWDYTVILGNTLSGGIGILNFFLMGLTVQSAVGKDEKDAAAMMKMSQSLRMVLLFTVAACGALLPCFHLVATLVPLFFPRIAVACRPLLDKNKKE